MKKRLYRYVILAALALLPLVLSACNSDTSTPEPSPAEAKENAQEVAASLELAGTAWQLDYFGEEADGLTVIEGTRPTLNLFVQPYGGTDGCNFFQGVYETDGSALTLWTPAQTRLLCEEPEGIMEQGATYISSLLNTVEYSLDGEQLVLYTTDQQRLATLSPAEEVLFEGTTWSLRFMKSGEDPLPLLPGTTVTVLFEGEQLSGSSGCNTYNGGYTMDGDNLTISENMVVTLMNCADPEGIMEQEQTYLAALTTVAGYGQAGGMLLLLDAEGEPILVFVDE